MVFKHSTIKHFPAATSFKSWCTWMFLFFREHVLAEWNYLLKHEKPLKITDLRTASSKTTISGFCWWAEQCLFPVWKDRKMKHINFILNAQYFLLDMKCSILVYSKSKNPENKHILSLPAEQINKLWPLQWHEISDGDVEFAFVSSTSFSVRFTAIYTG